MFYLLRGRVKEEFQQKSAGGEKDPKEGGTERSIRMSGKKGNGD
ncbi:MAG: hypothetical protein MPW15_19290 [Candidatus Manganitrophus sp.]|nr:hypothetical protein [Candidatus Manganitrophus sp.]